MAHRGIAAHKSPAPWLEGTWIRQARAVDDGPPLEGSDVVWLQVGPWFGTIRLPRPGVQAAHPSDEARAFSGRLEVVSESDTDATVVWQHDLDTHTGTGTDADATHLSLSGSVLVESGADSVQRWQRPHRDEPDVYHLVLEQLDVATGSEIVTARVVCVGPMAVGVWNGGEAGGALCPAAGDWEPSRLIGTEPTGLDLGAALRAGVRGSRLPAGWRVVEDR